MVNLAACLLLLCAKECEFQSHKGILLETLTKLGWQINMEKSVLEPQKSIPYLGFIIATSGPKGPYIQVSPQRVRKLRKDIQRALKLQCLTARALAKVAGQCISMTLAIVPGKLMLRNTCRLLSQRQSWSDRLEFDSGTTSDLQWWLGALKTWNFQSTVYKDIDVQMWTDASQTGWGATCLGQNAAGWWNHRLSRAPSNYRELMAVLLALKSFNGLLGGKKVQVLSDNVTTVAYINHLGGHCKELSDLAVAVWAEAEEQQITLTAKHLPGVINQEADFLSRIIPKYEWRLHPAVFHYTPLYFSASTSAGVPTQWTDLHQC